MNLLNLLSFLAAFVIANGTPLELPTDDFSVFFGTSRIVGGVDAPDNHAPYQVALVFGQESYPSLMCGGSIVSNKHVLTAAHCIDPFVWWDGSLMETLHARVGSNIWYSGGDVVRFKGYHNHPQWDPYTIKYDVGVLKVSTTNHQEGPLKFSKRVRPIALNYGWVDAGEESFVTGWGLTSAWGNIPRALQLLKVTTISPKDCAIGVKEAGQGWITPPVDPHAEICTFHSVGHGMCNGDSGSALVSLKDRRQLGLVSWGFPCAVGAPDVYTRLFGMKEFLQPILGHERQS